MGGRWRYDTHQQHISDSPPSVPLPPSYPAATCLHWHHWRCNCKTKKKRRKSPDHINSLFHCLCILSVLFFWAAFFLSPVEPVRIRMRHFVCHSHSTAADSRRCCASHPSCVGGSHCATVPPTRVHHAMYAA